MLIEIFQVTRHLPSPGVLVELLLVSHVYVAVVLTGPAREPLVTCVVAVECLHPQKHGVDGTEKSTQIREDMHCVLLLLPLVYLLLSCQKVKPQHMA